ncbi:alpha/beta fold hydrolase [Micromonospora phaseoli]|uniref:alpha/beta fold hydrolase n=1 Tax=Micromonospora phaseoli TaxID=1144548 RepID=UPI000B8580C1|nr:alpha/beta hydrolase [Micromonospora phaseoli]
MGYAEVNGVRLWYETHGSGRPLVLLHGGFGAVETFAAIRPALAGRRQVISVDLQGHGRTADVDRPLRYESMADDVAALIVHLNLREADVLGFSLGGGVALRMAIQHRRLLRRLVVVSAPCRRQGWFSDVLAGMPEPAEAAGERMRGTPPEQLYQQVAPRPQDWPRLWAKTGELLRREYDWSPEVATVTTPTLLVFADADSIRTGHMVEFFGLLGGGQRDGAWDGAGRPASRLAVLPGLTHYDIVDSPALPAAVLPFLTHTLPSAPTP